MVDLVELAGFVDKYQSNAKFRQKVHKAIDEPLPDSESIVKDGIGVEGSPEPKGSIPLGY